MEFEKETETESPQLITQSSMITNSPSINSITNNDNKNKIYNLNENDNILFRKDNPKIKCLNINKIGHVFTEDINIQKYNEYIDNLVDTYLNDAFKNVINIDTNNIDNTIDMNEITQYNIMKTALKVYTKDLKEHHRLYWSKINSNENDTNNISDVSNESKTDINNNDPTDDIKKVNDLKSLLIQKQDILRENINILNNSRNIPNNESNKLSNLIDLFNKNLTLNVINMDINNTDNIGKLKNIDNICKKQLIILNKLKHKNKCQTLINHCRALKNLINKDIINHENRINSINNDDDIISEPTIHGNIDDNLLNNNINDNESGWNYHLKKSLNLPGYHRLNDIDI